MPRSGRPKVQFPVNHYKISFVQRTDPTNYYDRDAGKEYPCTLGIGVRYSSPGLAGFLTNAHCTEAMAQAVSPTTIYQPGRVATNEPANRLGLEQVDPAPYGCPGPPYMCKRADVAFVSWNTAQADIPTLGRIARTTYSDWQQGSLPIDAGNPEFVVTGEQLDAVVGEDAEKIGRTTGWTVGAVVSTCRAIYVTRELNPLRYWSIPCGVQVDAAGRGGDSGAPVFKQVGGNNVLLMGLLHGQIIYTNNTAAFVYSPMSTIRQDLSNSLVTY